MQSLDKDMVKFVLKSLGSRRGFSPPETGVRLTGPDGGAIKTDKSLDLSALSDEDLDKLAELISKGGEGRDERG